MFKKIAVASALALTATLTPIALSGAAGSTCVVQQDYTAYTAWRAFHVSLNPEYNTSFGNYASLTEDRKQAWRDASRAAVCQ